MNFTNNFPYRFPDIKCLTNIFHPNIEAEVDGGGVCVSLASDWTPSNTLEDVIMSLLFLFYNPNVDDPLSGMVSDMSEEDFYKNHEKIMNGDMEELMDEFDIEENLFDDAKDRFKDLRPEEWDVLARAAKVAWSYQLEQEKWQTEVKEWEVKEQERKISENRMKFEDTVSANEPSTSVRVDHAFGKSSLQRCMTVTAPCGQANMLSFVPPQINTIQGWMTNVKVNI